MISIPGKFKDMLMALPAHTRKGYLATRRMLGWAGEVGVSSVVHSNKKRHSRKTKAMRQRYHEMMRKRSDRLKYGSGEQAPMVRSNWAKGLSKRLDDLAVEAARESLKKKAVA